MQKEQLLTHPLGWVRKLGRLLLSKKYSKISLHNYSASEIQLLQYYRGYPKLYFLSRSSSAHYREFVGDLYLLKSMKPNCQIARYAFPSLDELLNYLSE